jgi:hypothetical protein
MAFLSTPDVEWLYSGVTKMKPSYAPIFFAHALVCSPAYWPGAASLVEMRERIVEQIDELVAGRGARRRLVDDPIGDRLAVAAGARTAEDDGDVQVVDWVPSVERVSIAGNALRGRRRRYHRRPSA